MGPFLREDRLLPVLPRNKMGGQQTVQPKNGHKPCSRLGL